MEGVPEASYCPQPSTMKVGKLCAYANLRGEPYVVREAVILRVSQKIDNEETAVPLAQMSELTRRVENVGSLRSERAG